MSSKGLKLEKEVDSLAVSIQRNLLTPAGRRIKNLTEALKGAQQEIVETRHRVTLLEENHRRLKKYCTIFFFAWMFSLGGVFYLLVK